MFIADTYLPTRIVFGRGRLNDLKNTKLPGKKALLCVTADGLMKQLGIQQRVEELLRENGTEYAVFDKVEPNPTKGGVEASTALAKASGCDFVIGLGGGSSIDTAKASAIMMVSEGDLWDYAYTGTGGRKEVIKAVPVVTISTTCGTGTECDQYCVITNERTQEKLDFTAEAIFPALSIIDPELMLTLPRSLTIFQGFDALFHCAECYVCNGHHNRLLDLYAADGVRTVAENLTKALADPQDAEVRSNLAYAADILGGYCMALVSVTSHHILAQTLGGLYHAFPHGAALIVLAEAYYSKVCSLLPDEFNELGEMTGEVCDPARPGYAFVKGLIRMLDETGARHLKMSEYGVRKNDFERIVDMTVDEVGIGLDRYTLTKQDFMEMLEQSYR
jgi:alcohol dehydrogenase